MPRMQVYLPEHLYRQVKERRLPASELLQEAVRTELRRQALLEESDVYLRELIEEVGAPPQADIDRAQAMVRGIRERGRTERAS
jgi:hypothetical protein